MKDCTTCKYGFVDEQFGFPMCHHPLRFAEDCVDFNMHEEKEVKESEGPFKEPIDGVLYAAACGIKNKEQTEKSEKPIALNEELEKEMDAFLGDWKSDTLPEIQDDMLKFARHFAEWGEEHAKKNEPVSDDIEEAAEKESEAAYSEPSASGYAKRLFFKAGFKRGAKWRENHMLGIAEAFYEQGRHEQMEQMMKEAVEKEVLQVTKNRAPVVTLNLDAAKYKDGDKVRVIVLPKEG